jgi:hypothetical protein
MTPNIYNLLNHSIWMLFHTVYSHFSYIHIYIYIKNLGRAKLLFVFFPLLKDDAN